MRKSRFTAAQIIEMIKAREAGIPTAEACRRPGLSTATFCKLKSGMADWKCPTPPG